MALQQGLEAFWTVAGVTEDLPELGDQPQRDRRRYDVAGRFIIVTSLMRRQR